MANCPNCGAPLQKNGVCAACGYTCSTKPEDVDALLRAGKFAEASIIVNEELEKDENNGKACLDSVRIQTKNFSEKPVDKDKCLETAVRGLTYASDKDKANCEFKLLAYFENLNLGGRGVENVFDIKSSVSGNVAVNGKPGVAGHAAGGAAAGAAGAAAAKSSKKGGLFSKLRKPMSKKGKIITLIVSLVLVGAMIGIIVGVSSNGGGSKKHDEDTPSPSPVTSYTEITLNKNGGSGGTSYVNAYYNEKIPSISTPTKDGYTFTGYFDSDNRMYIDSTGDGYRYWDKMSSYETLYAHWEENSSTNKITVNRNYNAYGWSYNSSADKYTSYSGLGDGKQSQMQVLANTSCTVYFSYQVSSESGYDKFSVKRYNSLGNILSTVVTDKSGSYSDSISTSLSSGEYLIFEYSKDGSGSSGNDNVVVTNLRAN